MICFGICKDEPGNVIFVTSKSVMTGATFISGYDLTKNSFFARL
jgi:hypothetical protein